MLWKAGRKRKVLLSASAAAVAVALVMAVFWIPITTFFVPRPPSHPIGLCSDCGVSLGSAGTSFVGWLMPADTQISTSFVVGQPMDGFLGGVLDVFPYNVSDATILLLGLYVNGTMVASSKYDLSAGGGGPTGIIGTSDGQTANFSHSLSGYSVAFLNMPTTLEPGTTITMIAWVSHPIWVEIDDTLSVHSFESAGNVSSLPAHVDPQAGSLAPHTLAASVNSNKP